MDDSDRLINRQKLNRIFSQVFILHPLRLKGGLEIFRYHLSPKCTTQLMDMIAHSYVNNISILGYQCVT